ncbi:MAG: D-alanyl-D-alanine carboxypeptidase family protein [Solirubrobacterales bacterium]
MITSRRAPRVFVAVLIVAIMLTLVSTAAAKTTTRTVLDAVAEVPAPPMPTSVTARSATVIDAATGKALWSIRPTEQRLIASTTKIMTALVAIDRTTSNQHMTATDYAAAAAESQLGLRAGERMMVKDLIAALLLESANDAADTLAVGAAGSRGAFVAAMNRRARELGLGKTIFGNPIGLDNPRTVSTASDLAKLTRAAMKEPRFADIVRRRRATLRSGDKVRRIGNRNTLVGKYRYVDGVKTGHTNRAGYLLVGSATKRDARVISVVMGAPSIAARDRDSLKILRFGREFFKPVDAVSKSRQLIKLPVKLQDVTAAVYPRRNIGFALADGERYAVTLRAPEELEGPLAAGTRVGTATVTRNGKQVAQTAVTIRDAIEEPPIGAVVLDFLRRMLPLLAGLAIVFMLGLIFLRRRSAARSQSVRRVGEVRAEPGK